MDSERARLSPPYQTRESVRISVAKLKLKLLNVTRTLGDIVTVSIILYALPNGKQPFASIFHAYSWRSSRTSLERFSDRIILKHSSVESHAGTPLSDGLHA